MAVAEAVLHAIERPCISRDTGAPGSLMRRANDLGRELAGLRSGTTAMTRSGLKLHAMSLDASGDPSRNAWLVAAKAELNAVDTADDALFHCGVAEVVACLLNAYRPMSKDETRAFVERFLAQTIDADE